MKISEQVKSITFLKNNASEVIEKLQENRRPFIITQNGEAKAVLLDVHDYDEKIETIAILKRLVLAAKEKEQGKHRDVDEVFDELLALDKEVDNGYAL